MREDPLGAKRELAFVPDEPALFEHLTAWEHMQLTARLYGVRDAEPLARELFGEMELLDKKDELPTALSRGMKQKLSLACAFLHSPRAILLDEPLTGLDPLGMRRIKDSIVRRAREGAAVILSSHLLTLVEEMCHRVLIVSRGQKVFHGSKAEIAARYPALAAHGLEAAFLALTDPAGPPPVASPAVASPAVASPVSSPVVSPLVRIVSAPPPEATPSTTPGAPSSTHKSTPEPALTPEPSPETPATGVEPEAP